MRERSRSRTGAENMGGRKKNIPHSLPPLHNHLVRQETAENKLLLQYICRYFSPLRKLFQSGKRPVKTYFCLKKLPLLESYYIVVGFDFGLIYRIYFPLLLLLPFLPWATHQRLHCINSSCILSWAVVRVKKLIARAPAKQKRIRLITSLWDRGALCWLTIILGWRCDKS